MISNTLKLGVYWVPGCGFWRATQRFKRFPIPQDRGAGVGPCCAGGWCGLEEAAVGLPLPGGGRGLLRAALHAWFIMHEAGNLPSAPGTHLGDKKVVCSL